MSQVPVLSLYLFASACILHTYSGRHKKVHARIINRFRLTESHGKLHFRHWPLIRGIYRRTNIHHSVSWAMAFILMITSASTAFHPVEHWSEWITAGSLAFGFIAVNYYGSVWSTNRIIEEIDREYKRRSRGFSRH